MILRHIGAMEVKCVAFKVIKYADRGRENDEKENTFWNLDH